MAVHAIGPAALKTRDRCYSLRVFSPANPVEAVEDVESPRGPSKHWEIMLNAIRLVVYVSGWGPRISSNAIPPASEPATP
jgi:hypothetical protein